jgi:hypothetical protein
MFNFLRRGDPEQLRCSWYIFALQIPWLPEYRPRKDDWRNKVCALCSSGKIHTFTTEEIGEYKKASTQPGAMTAMINWYRAVVPAKIEKGFICKSPYADAVGDTRCGAQSPHGAS